MTNMEHVSSYLGSLYDMSTDVEYRSYFCQYSKCNDRDKDYA